MTQTTGSKNQLEYLQFTTTQAIPLQVMTQKMARLDFLLGLSKIYLVSAGTDILITGDGCFKRGHCPDGFSISAEPESSLRIFRAFVPRPGLVLMACSTCCIKTTIHWKVQNPTWKTSQSQVRGTGSWRSQLTFHTDRLPAIAGLGRYYGQLDPDNRYLFGIWSKTLHQGVLWVVISTPPRKPLAEGTTTSPPPLWSWGRYLGRINDPTHIENCVALFDIMESQPHSGASGQVTNSQELGSSSFLRLRIMVAEWLDARLHRTAATSHSLLSFTSKLRNLYNLKGPGPSSFRHLAGRSWVTLDDEPT
ncbi:hypothetical protein B0T10DRAFT_453341 [Thelonectria olida]|uniref:Uncharacterized protein n=1 Tax=Thelonectria olida TaxID=1576542 RepID=A0A9P8WFF4_9HYPO|nr:hypothetical protein B0T10DRAFT_453341 [Thelonectria olida]